MSLWSRSTPVYIQNLSKSYNQIQTEKRSFLELKNALFQGYFSMTNNSLSSSSSSSSHHHHDHHHDHHHHPESKLCNVNSKYRQHNFGIGFEEENEHMIQYGGKYIHYHHQTFQKQQKHQNDEKMDDNFIPFSLFNIDKDPELNNPWGAQWGINTGNDRQYDITSIPSTKVYILSQYEE
jgi:hypothetical protein